MEPICGGGIQGLKKLLFTVIPIAISLLIMLMSIATCQQKFTHYILCEFSAG